MKSTVRLLILMIGLLLLTACRPVSAPSATPPAADEAAQPAAPPSAEAGAAIPVDLAAALASELGVEPGEMTIVSAEPVDWPDACLGVTRPDEMCGQVITPGYRIVVDVNGAQYEYHTDRMGMSIRPAGEPQAQLDRPALELSLTRLSYAGPEEVGSVETSRCAQMEIANNQARLVACDGAETTLPLSENLSAAWNDLGNRVASFAYETTTEQVDFVGRGESAGPEWQRAVLAWARLTHAELASGQTGASARTALSWNLGLLADTPGVCAHLTVLDYGYAYAEQRACEGGDLVAAAEGWLEGAEMEQFDGWLYGYAPLYVDDNYLNGAGSAGMNEDEALAVAAWAQAVWTRLSGLSLAPVEGAMEATGEASAAASPTTCSAGEEGGDVFASPQGGFCLVAPAGYAVVESAPGAFSLVRGGDITNHVDPRVSIEVSEADGRTLAQVAEQMAADYAPPGETIEAQPVTVGGVEGILFDNLIGQDLNRRVAMVYDGRVYSLMMMPLSPEAEPFYGAVLDSLRFTAGS